MDKNHFVSYASRYWGVHVKSAEADGRVQQLAATFLSSSKAAAGAYQIAEFDKRRREEYWNPEECFSGLCWVFPKHPLRIAENHQARPSHVASHVKITLVSNVTYDAKTLNGFASSYTSPSG